MPRVRGILVAEIAQNGLAKSVATVPVERAALPRQRPRTAAESSFRALPSFRVLASKNDSAAAPGLAFRNQQHLPCP